MTAIALTIAGSDSGGGAGIQADLKTMSALGVYGASVVTAVTAQNTHAVTAIQGIDLAVIEAQIATVLSDLDVGAIKIGMLASSHITNAVALGLREFKGPVVLDPVMVAKSGDSLLEDEAVESLTRVMLPRANVLTPNLPEAARLLDTTEAKTPEEMVAQGRALCELGAERVLMKGGHGAGETCVDVLVGPGGVLARMEAPRRATKNTHGTGCTLSSAVAAGLAKGMEPEAACRAAHTYLQGAIARADTLQVGSGHGPVHHFHALWEAET